MCLFKNSTTYVKNLLAVKFNAVLNESNKMLVTNSLEMQEVNGRTQLFDTFIKEYPNTLFATSNGF